MRSTNRRRRLPWLLIGLPLLVTTLTWLGVETKLHWAENAMLEAHNARFACWVSVSPSCPEFSIEFEDAIACPQVEQDCRARGFDVAADNADTEYIRWLQWSGWAKLTLIAVGLATVVAWGCRVLLRRKRSGIHDQARGQPAE
jgi:hypothetical protein